MSQDQENGVPAPQDQQQGTGETGAQPANDAPASESTGTSDGAAAEQTTTQAVAAPVPQPEPAAEPAPPPAPAAAPAPQEQSPEAAPTAKAGAGTVEKTTAAAVSSVASTGAEATHLFGIPDVDNAIKDVPAAYLANMQRLKEYIAGMNPKRPTSLKDRVAFQSALFGVITNTVNRQEEYFRPMWTALIKLFAAHSADPTGVFHDANVFRDFDNIELKSHDRQGFARLLSLLQLSVRLQGASPEARAAQLKQFDFQDALRFSLTDSGRSRILEYYNVA